MFELSTGAETEQWETLCAGWLDEAVDPRMAGRCYRALSAAIVAGGAAATANLAEDFPPPVRDAVWAFVFAARTHAVARRLLSVYPPAPGAFVELGAGWGPFAAAAALVTDRARVPRLELWELAERGRRAQTGLAQSFPEHAVLHQPRDARAFRASRSVGGIAVPYSLREIFRGDVRAAAHAVADWRRSMAPSARIYLVAAGDKPNAQFLQQLRDQLDPAWVAGPCRAQGACPRLPKDWCHFTWRVPLGPTGRQIAAHAGRKAHELHFSWLVLGPTPSVAAAAHRVLEVHRDRRRTTVRTCGPAGAERWVALAKSPAHAALDALAPGDLATATGEVKGDGLRLRGAEDLRRLAEGALGPAPVESEER